MLLKLAAYAIIPVYTVIFVSGTDWLELNFTSLGNALGRREAFVLWGIIYSLYALYAFKAVIATRLERVTLYLSLSLLMLGIATPYFPERWPLQATLHVWFSFSAAVVITVCLGSVVLRIYRQNREKHRGYLLWYAANIAVSSVLFTQMGMVSSALEMFFSLSLVFMLERMRQDITEKKR